MNFLRRCTRATTTLPLPLPLPLPFSLSSRNSRQHTLFLRPLTRSSPYSTNPTWAPNTQEHSSSSGWSQEVNKQAKEPLADSSPRPREIPYQVKVANLVKLIGHIKLPVKFQSFPDGKHYAATLISENYKHCDKACWIPVLFEGDLAHVVSCHVNENDCVYVTGKLSVDPLPFVLQHQNQWGLHILAEDINFVEGFDEKAHAYSRKKNVKLAAVPDFADGNLDSEKKVRSEEIDDNVKHSLNERSAQVLKEGNIWRDLMKNPNQWRDFADHKSKGLVSQKHPDFKHTESGTALWLNSAPQWFLARFDNLDLGNDSRKEKMWKSLAENPDQWWDNRTDKKAEKTPDFKHKKTGEGLWLGDSPEWFVAKDIGIVKDRKEEAWKSLVENPNQWWDNRSDKKYENSSDFKHKETGERLWLDRSPDWVVSKLPPLKPNHNVEGV